MFATILAAALALLGFMLLAVSAFWCDRYRRLDDGRCASLSLIGGMHLSWIFSGRICQRNPQYALNRRSFRDDWRRPLRVYMVLGEAGAPAITGTAPKLTINNTRLES